MIAPTGHEVLTGAGGGRFCPFPPPALGHFLCWIDRAEPNTLHGDVRAHGALSVALHGFIADPRNRHRTDIDLLAHAYRRKADALAADLYGEYSVVIHDPSAGRVVATHDGLGIKPLFYSVGSERVVFASRLDWIVRHAGSGELDEEFLADYLSSGQLTGERTPYRHIRRLLPGESLLYSNDRVAVRRAWSLAQTTPVRLSSPEEYEDRLRALMSEAVSSYLPKEGPAWCELSGGLDSSSVVSIAAQGGVGRVGALSLVFTRSQTEDERKWIRAVTERYPVEWHGIDAEENPPYSEFPDDPGPEPCIGAITAGWERRKEELLRTHGVRVLLTGQGGDVVFWGDAPQPYHLADQARRLQLRRMTEGLRRGERSLLHRFLRYVVRPTWDRFRGRVPAGPRRYSLSPWIRRDYAERMRLEGRRDRAPIRRCGEISGEYFCERLHRLCAMLSVFSSASRAFEYRHPWLYRPLVEFMRGVPGPIQLPPGEDRSLQRRAMRGILPEAIRTRRRKATFDRSHAEGLRRSPAWLRILTENPRIARLGMVDLEMWREAVAQARFGRIHWLPQFDAAVTLEAWLRQF